MKETEENRLHISSILEENTFYSHPIFLIIVFSPNKVDFTSQGFVLNNIAKTVPYFFRAVYHLKLLWTFTGAMRV